MKLYTIHQIKTGLYSTGGYHPKFVKLEKAKIWKRRGDVSRHMRLLINSHRPNSDPINFYTDCEITPFMMVIDKIENREPIAEVLTKMVADTEEKEKTQERKESFMSIQRMERQLEDMKDEARAKFNYDGGMITR